MMSELKFLFVTVLMSSLVLLLSCAPPAGEGTSDSTGTAEAPAPPESREAIDEEPAAPVPALVAEPEKVRVRARVDGDACNVLVVPDVAELCEVSTDVCPDKANWEWVGTDTGISHVYFVIKTADLSSCLETQSILGGTKQGFPIPQDGVEKKVRADCPGPAEYEYGIVAKRSDGKADCEYDPTVKILD